MYAEDGQLRTSNTDLVSLEGRISLVINSENAWYENNRIIANYSEHQEMLLGNTEHHFHFSRLSNVLGLGLNKRLPKEYIKELKAKDENENTKNITRW